MTFSYPWLDHQPKRIALYLDSLQTWPYSIKKAHRSGRCLLNIKLPTTYKIHFQPKPKQFRFWFIAVNCNPDCKALGLTCIPDQPSQPLYFRIILSPNIYLHQIKICAWSAR